MTELLQKLRETAIRWGKMIGERVEMAWAWLRTKSAEWSASASSYVKSKHIPEKTQKCREMAAQWLEWLKQRSLELRVKASRWGSVLRRKSEQSWEFLKAKSAETQSSAKDYLAQKNVPEKVDKLKASGLKWLDVAKTKCALAAAWLLAKWNVWSAAAKKLYEEKIAKSIPGEGISPEETERVHRMFEQDGAAVDGASEEQPIEQPEEKQEESIEEKDQENPENVSDELPEDMPVETPEVTPEEEPEEPEPASTPTMAERVAPESVRRMKETPDFLAESKTRRSRGRAVKKRWSWKKRFLIFFLSLVVALPLLFVLFCYGVDRNAFGLFGASPTLGQLKNPIQMEASMIYSEDNDLLGKFFVENRSSVTYEELSPELIQTLVCTEDQRFYEHQGIDYHGMFSAAKDAVRGRARGASTITQQLVKNLFKMRSEYTKGALCRVPGIKVLIVKIKECIGAVRIENHYTKQEILTMYLNTVTFGNNTFGIKSAAKTYFNTTPDKLTYEQAACIIGILKANTYYNPIKNPENNRKRRNLILHLLKDAGSLDAHQCDSLCATDLGLNIYKEDILSGYAHYFREAVYNELQEWCEENNVNLYHDGLKIYTTVNSRMQHYAEACVAKQMGELQKQFNKHWGKENPWRDQKQHEIKGFIDDMLKKTSAYKALHKKYKGDGIVIDQELRKPHKMRIFDYKKGITDTVMSTRDSLAHILKFLHCGFIAMDPHTGAVKAWVGDVDFYYWQYDKVTAKRQPGSTFKLFVYTEALRQGMCSCDTRIDSAVSWMTEEDGEWKLWAPQNASGVFSNEPMTLKTALARSVNSVAVQIAKQVTPEKIVQTAHRMGIESPVRPIPSLCLGTEDVSLIELATAYSVIADGGMLHKPILVSRIEDKDGKVIYRSKVKNDRALDEETAFLMRDMLQEGLRDEHGTSQGLYKYKIHNGTDFGGKTGTSANYSDAWYMNVTPNLVTGAWVGGEYRSIHFRNGDLGQGSRAALPIVGLFLEKVLNDKVLASQYRGRFGAPKTKIRKEYLCKPIETEEQADTTESAMRGFFKRLFGRDDDYQLNNGDSTNVRKSRRELRRERRERRRERRRR
jgi:Membrane carboxypeptidase/penicillin-binding protein